MNNNGVKECFPSLNDSVQGAAQGGATFILSFIGGRNGLFFNKFKLKEGSIANANFQTRGPLVYQGIPFKEATLRTIFVGVPSSVARLLLDIIIPEKI